MTHLALLPRVLLMNVRILSRIRQLDSLAAIQALGHMEPQEDVLQTLAHYLGHADVLVPGEVVRAITGMDPLAALWLVSPLADNHFAVRWEAVAGLGKMGQGIRARRGTALRLAIC